MGLYQQSPLIFDVKRHALDDGPGMRTVIFFKGCPLHCLWCHNPESIDPDRQIGFYPSECIACGDCKETCTNGAIRLDIPLRIDRNICQRCGTCVDTCPGRGLRNIGRYYEVDKLMDIILRDKEYYQTSGGGVTLSGGEATMHMDYVSQLLQQLKQEDIHIAIETCGFFDYSEFSKKMLEYLDLILFDIKLADSTLHRKYTGKSNEVILENLGRLSEERPDAIIPRIPLIPGITAKQENLRQIAAIIKESGLKRCWLMPYNPLGFSKLAAIGKSDSKLTKQSLSVKELSKIKAIFSEMELVDL